MKISRAKQGQILSTIGLLLERSIISYNESHFKKYISLEYLNSDRKQSDEIYRMFEITLLHNDSGLRITYTTTESYYGDRVEYNLIDIFIITLAQKRLDIVDVDFSKKVFFTPNDIVPFTEADRLIEF